MLHNLLIYRFLIFNACAAAVFAVLAYGGLVQHVVKGDKSHIVIGIIGLFALTLVWTARKGWRTSKAINELKVRQGWRTRANVSFFRDKDLAKTKWLTEAPGWMVMLGLLGTVIGFAIVLDGDTLNASTLGEVKASIKGLTEGMGVAINTTIAGSVLGLWTEINTRMLRTAQRIYWADRANEQHRVS